MRHFIFAILFIGFIISTVHAQNQIQYQVISSDPHVVQALQPFIQTRFKGGRMWLVSVKVPASTPKWVYSYLRQADPNRVGHYVPSTLQLKAIKLPPIDDSYLKMINLEVLQLGVSNLTNFKDRSAGSKDNQAAHDWLASELKKMGYAVASVCYKPGACSVIAERKGLVSPQNVILVEGHFDSVGHPLAGADDNASGTIATLEIARVLQGYKNKSTLRFFLTNGEENGLLGATDYVKRLVAGNEIKNIKLAINMDMVGYNANGIVELETEKEWNGLATWFAALTETHTKLKSKITIGAWGSDHVPFLKAGVPTLMTIEYWDTKTPCYHAACDKPSTINFPYMLEITKLNTAAVLTADMGFVRSR